MSAALKLPVGIDNFEKLRTNGFYYIDKTKLIEQLLSSWGEVNLFTRPRRFGKSLNMSMLRTFFEIGTDPSLFDGLYIAGNKSICDEYMGKFPVIFVSLKNVDGLTFDHARYRLVELIGHEAERFRFLSDSTRLNEEDKNKYRAITAMQNGLYIMDDKILESSLQVLSGLLYKHCGRKTVILIDEYDVPLDKAFRNGYYREMVSLVRGLFGMALKTNDSLQIAVLTGCLRVSKESIFTGLNNFKVMSVTENRFDEQFGFTETEVEDLLAFYHMESHLNETREWYDGYRFGNADIYCPWDVINHVDRLIDDQYAKPQAYWINSSGNDLVKRFIGKADQNARSELERLVAGGTIRKRIRQDLTYDELDTSLDHLWSVLFTTGYLTLAGSRQDSIDDDIYTLKIPNEEIRKVYVYQIQEWFSGTLLKSMNWLPDFWHAFEEGNAKLIEDRLTLTMSKTISVYDIRKPKAEKPTVKKPAAGELNNKKFYAEKLKFGQADPEETTPEEAKSDQTSPEEPTPEKQKSKKQDPEKTDYENSYHTFLLGMFAGNAVWRIESNRESGDGRPDIVILPEDPDAGIVIELKTAESVAILEKKCQEALEQIKERRYADELINDGRTDILYYGIAFYKKRCSVCVEKMK